MMAEGALAMLAEDSGIESRERLGLLFDRCHRRLYRLALRMSSNDDAARDLVQEAFLRAARRPSAIPDDEDRAEAWLVRVIVNLCRDRYRRSRVRTDAHELLDRPEPVRDHGDSVITSLAVRNALASLPPRRRAVIVLHELEGMPPADIANTLGVSRVTVRWHLSKARKDLAEILIAGSESKS